MPHTRSLTAVVFFITLSPSFRCFLCNQVASRRRGFWEDQVMPGLTVNANVPSRRTVCLCTGRFRACLFGLASRSKGHNTLRPHGRRSVLRVRRKPPDKQADSRDGFVAAVGLKVQNAVQYQGRIRPKNRAGSLDFANSRQPDRLARSTGKGQVRASLNKSEHRKVDGANIC
jgi:hypothetical protein